MVNFYNWIACATQKENLDHTKLDREISERFPGFVLNWEDSNKHCLVFIHLETAKNGGDAEVAVIANYREPYVRTEGPEYWMPMFQNGVNFEIPN